METDYCVTRKHKLNKIIKKPKENEPDLLVLIRQKVSDVNKIVTLGYQLLKAYYLYRLENNKSLPLINTKFIGYCLKLVSIKINNKGPKSNNTIFKDLKLYYEKYFKKNVFANIQAPYTDLSYILSYSNTTILTAIENNIKFHFTKRLSKFLNIVFMDSNIDKIYMKIQITKIKNDLLNGTETAGIEYQKWIIDNRRFLLPNIKSKIKSYHYDIKVNPTNYLPGMIYMNNYIESMNGMQFHCFPLRKNIVPKYIEIDTCSLIQLTATKGSNDKLKNLKIEKPIIWNQYFNIENKVFSSNKTVKLDDNSIGSYKFHGNIQTDGIGVSIRLSLSYFKDGEWVKYRKRKKKKKTQDAEFPYLDELDDNKFNEMKQRKKVYIDPGKNNIIYCIDDKGQEYSYSTKKRLNETKRLKHNKIIETYRKKNGVEKLESKISLESGKTTNYKKFMNYLKIRNKVNSQTIDFYNELMFRNMRLRTFIETDRSEKKVVNELEKLYGTNCVLMYGDKNIGKQMRNLISSPMIGFKRMLKRKFEVYNIDEFRTSCLDYRTTDDNLIKNKNPTVKCMKDGQLINKKLHGILVSQILRKDSIGSFLCYQNRDRNACLNIKALVNYELEKGNTERPY
ncbi:MAG: hypothetical protein HQ490_05280, partial [Lutibacter sp.]|nr:hypothetical protein [Lutibacter sp.]